MSIDGMTPGGRAAWDRVLAGIADLAAVRLRLDVTAHDAAGAFRDLGAAMEAADFRLALDEAEAVATHPDLVELNVAMDGWYA
jgi:hypothetical protein